MGSRRPCLFGRFKTLADIAKGMRQAQQEEEKDTKKKKGGKKRAGDKDKKEEEELEVRTRDHLMTKH